MGWRNGVGTHCILITSGGLPIFLRTFQSFLGCIQGSDHWLYVINLLLALELVYLAGCELYSIPLAVLHHLNLTYLISLDLQGNGFNSGIPLWLSHMTYLTNLHLAGNYFYGPFPNFLSKLTSLTVLGIFSNGLSNSIPNSLCYMSSLVTLYLHFNHFQGSLPNCIGNLSSLKELNLDFNKISGNLPTECFVLSFCT